MEQITNNRTFLNSKQPAILLLVFSVLGKILAGPKLGIAIFAWLVPCLLVYFFRVIPLKRKLLWVFPFLLLGNFIASYNVIPFPLPVLVILMLLSALKDMLLYLLDCKLFQKTNHFAATLFFPACCVALEYMNTKTGGGAWWSIANSQYSFSWLQQLASVTGIWGISFLIYWFASVLVWAMQRYKGHMNYKTGLIAYSVVLLLVLVFGAARNAIGNNDPKLKIAGITAPVFSYLQAMYKNATGKDITINPRLSVASPELQQINLAQVPFIETADTIKYKSAYHALQTINDSLFELSQLAVSKGAKMIVWSEANAIDFNFNDKVLTDRGSAFAAANKVYLLMAMAIMEPGKISPGKKFIENKAVFFGPDGSVLNTFHKNKPVPFAESSKPGDGKIPVIETPYGRVSTSICYDADFPLEMQQLSANKAGVLLLPSGDWYSISPYHTQMAVLRAIENGCSLVRQVSGGLSVAVDYRGKQYARLDFYKPGTKLWVANVPVAHRQTIYSMIGDVFAYLCMVIVLAGLVYLGQQKLSRKIITRKEVLAS